MFTIFYKKNYSKNLVVKVVFGDRVDVLNDFLYNMEGVSLYTLHNHCSNILTYTLCD